MKDFKDITVAADIMGGDNPPEMLAKGVFDAVKEIGCKAVLVGTEEVCEKLGKLPENVTYRVAGSTVYMTDEPKSVIRNKKDSSMAVACRMCKDGEVDCVVSAGNTGALFTCASLTLRRIKGVRRAALCAIIPFEQPVILLDCGANLDSTPEILSLYAKMGSAYAEKVFGVESPRVGLLNNGTESHKGTALYSETYKLLSADKNVNFAGNCEGKSVPFGVCDVLVSDGFTGNIFLKSVEGVAKYMSVRFKECFTANVITMLGSVFVAKQLKKLKKSFDPNETGGAPFLGLAYPIIKAHGSSNDYAFCSAVKQVCRYTAGGVIDMISSAMAENDGDDKNERN